MECNSNRIEYDYQITDNLDLVLSEGVTAGFFDIQKLHEAVNNKEIQVQQSKLEDSFNIAWRKYHDSFDDNQEELVNDVYTSFKANAANISPTNLHGTFSLLKELGEDKKAYEILERYVEVHKGNRGTFDISEHNFFGDIKDPEIIDRFNAEYTDSLPNIDPVDALLKIAKNSSWSNEDIECLSSLSVEDYIEIYKSQSGEHFSALVATSLKHGNVQNAEKALKKIASESELNKRRVKKYGIDIEG